jgi:hypothetical protein
MATDHERYADEIIPTSYASWRYCIEVKCGLPLTRDFVQGRIRVLADGGAEETRRFAKTYGQGHLERVMGWFRQAAAALETSAGVATGAWRDDRS